MKESSHKSKKRTKESHNDKNIKRYDDETIDSDKYRNVLKERHCRDDYDRNGKDHRSNSKHSICSKEKSKSSDHKGHRNHPKSVISSSSKSEGKKHKSRNHEMIEESYEELSRKKRKIESELYALDMEEAAAKEAESKKSHRQSADNRKRREETVRIKEEPITDDERDKRSKEKSKNKLVPTNKSQRSKPQSSKSSGDDEKWGNTSEEAKKVENTNKEKPNFAVSGKLAEDTNTYNGVVIKYNEPAEARKPHRRWRLYPFKGDSDLPFIPIHRQSAYLFGRTRSIADIPIDHPSCSKQHAVLQFRLVTYKREDGTTGRRVRPYIIDLESSNGTFVNNKKVDPRCYVELMEKDVIKFGYSSREYVVLHEESRNEEEDDDVLDSN